MTRKRILYGLLSLIAIVIIGVAIYLNSLLPIITGYAAKNLCSAVFISGRQQEEVERTDLNFSFIKYTRNTVDTISKSVVSRFLWGRSRAIFRDGFGTTLLRGVKESELRKIRYPSGMEPGYSRDTIPWPMGDMVIDTVTGLDRKSMEEVTKRLIDDDAYGGDAFAFMVVYRGIPVAEAYKPQFTRHTRFISWSMAKSFMNALVGIMSGQGRADINQPVGLPEWKNDERNKITLNDLMQMQSGLKWNEDYGNRSDVTLMLYCERDMARFTYEKPAVYPKGSVWYYSSGSTNIVSYLVRRLSGNDSAYYSFINNQLFNKIGMPDAIYESDPSGTVVGSSYLYASARDYARFGLLFRNDGVFDGKRILPEGWVGYSVTEASSSGGQYGSFFWLNRSKKLPSAPEDMFSCQGHDGQRIFIMPSRDLIVVVLGYSPSTRNAMDFDRLLKDILSTIR